MPRGFVRAALDGMVIGTVFLSVLFFPVAILLNYILDFWEALVMLYLFIAVPTGGFLGMAAGIADVFQKRGQKVAARRVQILSGGTAALWTIQFALWIAGGIPWGLAELIFIAVISGLTVLVAVLFGLLGWFPVLFER